MSNKSKEINIKTFRELRNASPAFVFLTGNGS